MRPRSTIGRLMVAIAVLAVLFGALRRDPPLGLAAILALVASAYPPARWPPDDGPEELFS